MAGLNHSTPKAPLAPHNASQAARPACEPPKLPAIVHVITTSKRVDQRIHGAALRTCWGKREGSNAPVCKGKTSSSHKSPIHTSSRKNRINAHLSEVHNVKR